MIWGSLRSKFYCTKVLFEKREYRFKCIVVEWLVYLTFPFKHIFLFKCTLLYCHLIKCSSLLPMLCDVTKHLLQHTSKILPNLLSRSTSLLSYLLSICINNPTQRFKCVEKVSFLVVRRLT